MHAHLEEQHPRTCLRYVMTEAKERGTHQAASIRGDKHVQGLMYLMRKNEGQATHRAAIIGGDKHVQGLMHLMRKDEG